MRRRITFAMVAMVAVALLIAGAVTAGVSIHAQRVDNRTQLLREAKGLAVAVQKEAEVARPRDPAVSLRTVIRALKAPLRLQDDAVVAVGPGGTLFDPANIRQAVHLPSGLTPADLDVGSLLAGRDVTGSRGGLAYVAVAYHTAVRINATNRDVVEVVVLSRRSPTGLSTVGPWFLIASLLIIVAAFAVADRLGRRFLRPLQATQRTTGAIAAGDLDARVGVGGDVDPELGALGASVNAMADSLARSRSVERTFLLSVSHDLRTPLTAIRGFAEAIHDGVTTDPAGAAETILAESARLERLVGDLLDLAKLDARHFSLQMMPVDLSEVVEATVGGFARTAAGLGLTLSLQPHGTGPLPVIADADRLGQVIANLAENALSFARSEVRVGTSMANGQAMVWVDDDGPGIPPEDLPRVFERLYSSRPEVSRAAGSGLGLAIVAELVAAMGGQVRAESPIHDPHGGTRMIVTLPTEGRSSGQPRHP